MTSNHFETTVGTLTKPTLVKVANAAKLYRLAPPGDKSAKPTRAYYGVVKSGSKQFRRSKPAS